MRHKKFPKIPEATIKRLSIYNRILNELSRDGIEVVSSARLSEISGLNAAQIRKDLTYFGEFGVRGVGYFVAHLRDNIKKILGINRQWNLIIIGAGKLGQAILSYGNLRSQGYNIVAAFDNDPSKVGNKIGAYNTPIYQLSKLNEIVKKYNVKIAILTTPAVAAHEVLTLLEDANIEGIINFAPVKLNPQKNIKISYVDLVAEFDKMVFKISSE